ncbi:MAG: hypothetical protein H6Q17_1786 [Bacteroidetes bacterium]|nr:hypothetical protein [Bacteroidota bacterium]
MNVRIKELIHPNVVNFSLSLVVAGLLWMKEFILPAESTPLLYLFNTTIIPAYSAWLGLLLNLGIAYFSFKFLEKYTFLQQRTFLPFLFFILLSGSYPHFHYLTNGLIAASLLMMCLWQVFSTYHQNLPLQASYNAGLFLSLGYFFCFDFIFLIPFLFIILNIVNNLNVRLFLATLLGIFTPAILVFGISFWLGQLDNQLHYFMSNIVFNFSNWTSNIALIVVEGIFTILSLIAIMGCSQNRFNSSITERRNFQVLVWLYAAMLVILWVKMGHISELLPSFLMICALIFSIFFSTRSSRKNTILFALLVIFQVVTLILGYSGTLH